MQPLEVAHVEFEADYVSRAIRTSEAEYLTALNCTFFVLLSYVGLNVSVIYLIFSDDITGFKFSLSEDNLSSSFWILFKLVIKLGIIEQKGGFRKSYVSKSKSFKVLLLEKAVF